MVEWIARAGGLAAMAIRNAEKANLLYACLDRHDSFEAPVAREARSRMNVVFRLADCAREPEFLKAANAAGLLGLEGHRAVGGIRVSLYNAVELTSVQTLVAFLDEFARQG
jgi:phosphoserine aminotransferase